MFKNTNNCKNNLDKASNKNAIERYLITPDIEVLFEFNNVRKGVTQSGYRPSHLIKENYLATGIHNYYNVLEVPPSGKAKGTITFLTPEEYPNCLWVGQTIKIQERRKSSRKCNHNQNI